MILISDKPLALQKILTNLKTENSGSLVFHVGVVRPFSEGKQVTSIEYQIPKDGGESELAEIVSRVRERWEIDDVVLCRRTGRLDFGEIILIAAVSAARHKQAFDACQFAVEQMKGMKSVKKDEILNEMLAQKTFPLTENSCLSRV